MGIKESFPLIRGESIKINLTNEQKYFERSKALTRIYFEKNYFSNDNLKKSFEIKSFSEGKKPADKNEIKDIDWIEYLNIYLNRLYGNYKASWIPQFLDLINNKNILISENKYYSDIFFYEYELFTLPDKIITENEKISKEINNNQDYVQETPPPESEYPFSKSFYNDEYLEIDVIDNLGGSYMKVAQDEIEMNYQERRRKVKRYVGKIQEHLYYNEDHPFHQAIKYLNEEFCKYINQKIKEYEDQLSKEVIDHEKYESNLKSFLEEINYCLKEIISRMHSALKLFYSRCIDLRFLDEEKDDLFNLVVSAIFRIGNLYKDISELYMKCYNKEFKIFQERLIKLKDVNPKLFGLDIKFCLNEDTLELQRELKEKKENLQEDNHEISNDILEKTEEICESEPKSIKIETIIKEKEVKEEKANIFKDILNENQNIVIENDNNNFLKNKNIILTNKGADDDFIIRSKSRISILNKKENYILENISNIGSFKYDNLSNFEPNDPIRKTIDNFNNKTYFFPNLNQKLKSNAENSIYAINTKKQVPYLSAINFLKSIIKYKTPFEKLVLLAAISDQIMENANNFWKEMKPYIKKDYLNIEADDILNIFLYVLIQTQMPEILIENKIINNFTTELIKSSSLAYNLSLLEASIDYINGLKDINNLNVDENELKDASKKIYDKTTERLSRISIRLSNNLV